MRLRHPVPKNKLKTYINIHTRINVKRLSPRMILLQKATAAAICKQCACVYVEGGWGGVCVRVNMCVCVCSRAFCVVCMCMCVCVRVCACGVRNDNSVLGFNESIVCWIHSVLGFNESMCMKECVSLVLLQTPIPIPIWIVYKYIYACVYIYIHIYVYERMCIFRSICISLVKYLCVYIPYMQTYE